MLPRSFLFVPANRPDRFEKAARSGAHRVIIDLEDAVAPEDKDAARVHVAQWEGRSTAIVRINGADSHWFAADMAMVANSGVTMLMVPKADPAALDLVAGYLGQSCRAIALIETVAATQTSESSVKCRSFRNSPSAISTSASTPA
jgi:citrate lyase subunit beta/citryl-CoA lyase